MFSILHEPASIRDDFGILVLTQGEPCKIPFSFEIESTNLFNESIYADIKEDDIIEYTIKQDINQYLFYMLL